MVAIPFSARAVAQTDSADLRVGGGEIGVKLFTDLNGHGTEFFFDDTNILSESIELLLGGQSSGIAYGPLE